MTELAALLAPWQSFYADHPAVSTTVIAVHILALLLGGGLAIATDRATLRVLRERPAHLSAHLEELARAHRAVVPALLVIILSGLLMAAADLETFATSLVFWTKMALVALLIVNGAILRKARVEQLRSTARLSLALWLLITVAGVVLANV